MLIILIIQLLITFCCICAGFIFYDKLDKSPRSMMVYGITGLILITVIGQVIALFIAVKVYFFQILFFILVAYVLLNANTKNFLFANITKLKALPISVKIGGIMLWLMLGFISAGPVMMDDTETYHIQMIKWIDEYGSVPGLVNLHERFGFNSSWFSTVAFFNGDGIFGLYTTMNGLLSVWMCFYLIQAIHQKFDKGKQIAIAAAGLLLIGLAFWPFIRGNAATTNYDHISALVILVLFIEAFKTKQDKEFSFSVEWILWPVFLCSVRVMHFPLIILCMYGIVQLIKKKDFRTLSYGIILSILIMIPFLWRNIIVSGYPFYPSFAFNLFQVDWKADPQMMDRLLEYIKYYNRVSTAYLDLEQTRALGQTGWVSPWFRHLLIYDKIIFVTGISGLVAMLVSLIRNRQRSRPLMYFLLAMILFIITWFLVAPDPRFIYGCLFAGTFALFYHVSSLLKINFTAGMTNILFILLSASVFIYITHKLITENNFRNWVTPSQLPVPPTNDIEHNGFEFHIPEKVNNNWNARCYGTHLPCLYKLDPALEPRGETLKQGFRLKK